jgi:hypothetical protein
MVVEILTFPLRDDSLIVEGDKVSKARRTLQSRRRLIGTDKERISELVRVSLSPVYSQSLVSSNAQAHSLIYD